MKITFLSDFVEERKKLALRSKNVKTKATCLLYQLSPSFSSLFLFLCDYACVTYVAATQFSLSLKIDCHTRFSLSLSLPLCSVLYFYFWIATKQSLGISFIPLTFLLSLWQYNTQCLPRNNSFIHCFSIFETIQIPLEQLEC